MAPTMGCLNAAGAEETAQEISSWKDRLVGNLNEQYAQHGLQGTSVSHEESHERHGHNLGDHLLDEDDDVIDHSIQREAGFMVHTQYAESYHGIDRTDLQESRERAVYYMMTVQAYYGFNPCTAFLAVSYFDRFLANQQENLLPESRRTPWLLQLLAVGCMSLAAKAEESEVPLLLDLQVGHVPHVFEARTIQRMELLILSTLKWRLSSVTPFSFLGYLLQKMRISGRSFCSSLGVLPRAEELILNSCRDPRFTVFSPSVLAMASLICACDELLCGQLAASSCEDALLSVWPNRKKIVVDCTRLMQELMTVNGADHRHPSFWNDAGKLIVPLNSHGSPDSPNQVLDAAACFSCESGSTTCSLISIKRRVLSWRSGSAHAADCTSLRSTIAKAATIYSRSPSPSVCKAAIMESCSSARKRKFNERSYTSSLISTAIGIRAASQEAGEPAPIRGALTD